MSVNGQNPDVRYPSIHTLDATKPSKQYTASCHCQQITYTVTLSPPLDDPSSSVIECNCTICTRNGSLNIYVHTSCIEFPAALAPEKYSFGKHRVQHYFCPRCGSSLMAESVEPGFYEGVRALNVRMFEGVDVRRVRRRKVDGRSL